MSSDVELVAFLARAQKEGLLGLERPLEGQERLEALETLIDRLVVVVEAERLKVFTLGTNEVSVEYEAFVSKVGREELEAWLRRRGWTMDDVRTLVELEASVRRYLEGRFRLVARPRPAQVREAYEVGVLVDGRSFDELKAVIEARLEQERFDELVAQFTNDVRRRARVRVLRDVSDGRPGVAMHGRAQAPQVSGERR